MHRLRAVPVGLPQRDHPPHDRDGRDPGTGKTKKRLVRYEYDLGSCMFCHLCVNACPTGAIRFSTDFEHAVYTREKLVKQLNKQ